MFNQKWFTDWLRTKHGGSCRNCMCWVSVLYFVLVTDGWSVAWPRVVPTMLPCWSLPSAPATGRIKSVESEKILSRMIFQSQLWRLLLLSFWDYGHRVMTLCHQLFCREIFRHGENRGREAADGSNLDTSQFQLGIYCQLLALPCKQAGNSSRSNVVSCFISVMSVGPVIRASASNLSLPRTSPSISCHWNGLISIWCLGRKYSSLVSISRSRSSGQEDQIPW